MRLVAEQPLPRSLPKLVMILVTRFVIPQRLPRVAEVLVQLRHFAVEMKTS